MKKKACLQSLCSLSSLAAMGFDAADKAGFRLIPPNTGQFRLIPPWIFYFSMAIKLCVQKRQILPGKQGQYDG